MKLVLGILLLLTVKLNDLNAHDHYPAECCHNLDCGEITSIYNMVDGGRHITIKLVNGLSLSAIFPKEFPISPALDNKDHACIGFGHKPLCLFLNGAV